jgi:glyoxylase-like metal-dependent hydrolase (beta-lactamase superfamily II)
MVIIESEGKTAAFVADLIPTSAHLPDVWVMGYDLFPIECMAAKQRFVAEAIERETLVFFEHDPVIAAGYLREENKKRTVVPGG